MLSHNTLRWSVILGLSFFVWCWWPRESMLWGSSALSEFRTSLSKVLTLWHCVKVKQHYLRTTYLFATSTKNDTSTNSHFTWNSFYCYSKNKNICWYYIIWQTLAFRLLLRAKGFAISNKVILCTYYHIKKFVVCSAVCSNFVWSCIL